MNLLKINKSNIAKLFKNKKVKIALIILAILIILTILTNSTSNIEGFRLKLKTLCKPRIDKLKQENDKLKQEIKLLQESNPNKSECVNKSLQNKILQNQINKLNNKVEKVEKKCLQKKINDLNKQVKMLTTLLKEKNTSNVMSNSNEMVAEPEILSAQPDTQSDTQLDTQLDTINESDELNTNMTGQPDASPTLAGPPDASPTLAGPPDDTENTVNIETFTNMSYINTSSTLTDNLEKSTVTEPFTSCGYDKFTKI